MNITDLEIREITENDISLCRELCNELMKYQAAVSFHRTDVLNEMSFDNRLKPSYQNAQMKKLLVAFDNLKPIGYVYADVADLEEDARTYVPEWAHNICEEGQLVFYPPEQKFPARIGTFNNIYIKPEYHGSGLGGKLTHTIMEWMKNTEGISGIYVYVSNGNHKSAEFYKKYGFRFSHDVLGGFVRAYYLNAEGTNQNQV